MNAVAEKSETKTPSNRLLDLLHGWKEFAYSDETTYPDPVVNEALADAYQEAGVVACRDYPDKDTERDAACRFVIEKVLPLLLK